MYTRFERSIDLSLHSRSWQASDGLPLLLVLMLLLLPHRHSALAALLVLITSVACTTWHVWRVRRWSRMIWSDVHGIRLRGPHGEFPARLKAVRFRSSRRVLLDLDCLARTYRLCVCRTGQTQAYRRLLQCLPDRAAALDRHA